LDHKLLTGQPSKQLTLSDKYRLAIMGSLVFPEENHYYNRMVLSDAQGSMDFYDKRHLFMEENKRGLFKAGAKRKTFLVRGVEIMPQICYDLRFPVWSRNNLNYQVLVYSANWPEVRQEVWDTLLRARAIENQCYVVGINRVGVDGNGISYKGGSVVYSPKGESMLNIEDEENYSSITISLSSLSAFREKFPVYKDADSFTID
jgi:omega-amidase